MPLLQPQQNTALEIGKILGDSGTRRYSGYFSEEFSLEWLDARRIDNVEEMRRSDATVKQLLNALKAPLLSVTPTVEVDSDDPIDIKAKELCEKNIFGMRRTWKEFFREGLTDFDFGFSIFELIWERRNDGFIHLADLEPRIQRSILRWQLDDGRRGVVQLLSTDEVPYLEAQIPMNKLLVFTNDKEGDDLTGQSVLRPAWKHFYYKDNLYRIGAIACERYGVGIPVITVPQTGEAEKATAAELGRNLKSNEEAHIVLPSPDWKIEILTPSGNPQSQQIDQLIQHHDRMILCVGLAAFLNLGSGSTGSFALSEDQSSFFLKHAQDKALYHAEQITKQVFERLVKINFGPRDKYPYLKFPKIGDIDMPAYAGVIKTLTDATLFKARPKDMQFIRETFDLPVLSDEELEELEIEEQEAKIKELEAGLMDDPFAEEEDDMPINEEIPEDNFDDEEEEVTEEAPVV